MSETTDQNHNPSWLGWICVVIVMGLTVWAYFPALDAGFIFDDEQNIVGSPAVHWTEVSWENVQLLLNSSMLQRRPVANLSFALDHLAWGLEPRGFHLTNLLIHLAVGGALIWVCLLYMNHTATSPQSGQLRGITVYLVLVTVGVFLLHPLNTQAVSYVVQRMTSLAALFVLLAFACYLMARYRLTSRSRWWYAVGAILWIMGIGNKENAILLLPVVLIYEICFFRIYWQQKAEDALGKKWTHRWTISAWAGVAVVAVLAIWAAMASSNTVGLLQTFEGRDFSGLERIITQTRVQLFYLSLLLWPSPERLSLDHDFSISTSLLDSPTTLLAASTCLVLAVGAVLLAKRYPRYGFPIIAYMVFHAIEAGPVNLELIFEHRMYLPSSMLTLTAVALLLDARPDKRIVAATIMFALFFPLASWTHARNHVWADPVHLQGDIARKAPNNIRAQHNFAVALVEAGRNHEAQTIVQNTIALDPSDERPRKLLGDIFLNLGRPSEALQAYQTALKLAPKNIPAVLGIGAALVASDREEAAFLHFLNTGTRFGQEGLPWQAIPILQEAVKLRAEDAGARHALGSAYLLAGLSEQALEQCRIALRLDPTKVETWYNLGLAADASGLRDEAMRAYRGFLERAPPELQKQVGHARTRIVALESVR